MKHLHSVESIWNRHIDNGSTTWADTVRARICVALAVKWVVPTERSSAKQSSSNPCAWHQSPRN